MTADNKSNKKAKLKIKSWYSNRYQIVVVQRNILLLFTLISMFSVAVAVIFVKTIMSSKSLEPYVIEVEQKTGVATVVTQLTSQNFIGEEAVKRYFVNEFIQSAVAYDPRTYRKDAEKVRVFSAATVYSNFRSRINPKELGTDATIEVRVKSIQFTESNNAQIQNAQIRILQQLKNSNGTTNKDYLIDLTFYFAPETNLNMEERLINPLGFQVSKIRITEEVFNY
jgi:type IV secretion system protein VirB8